MTRMHLGSTVKRIPVSAPLRIVAFAAGFLILFCVFATFWTGSLLNGVRWLRGQDVYSDSAANAFELNEKGLTVSSCDIGTIVASPKYQHVLKIRNHLNRPVTIRDIQVSCGCVHVIARRASIAAHDTADVLLEIDFTQGNIRGSIDDRDWRVDLFPILEESILFEPWTLTATVKDLLNPVPPQSVGSLSAGETFSHVVRVTPKRKGGEITLEVVGESDKEKMSIDHTANGYFEVHVAGKAPKQLGHFTKTYRVSTRDQSGETSESESIIVSGEVTGSIEIYPDFIDTGICRLDKSVSRDVIVVTPEDYVDSLRVKAPAFVRVTRAANKERHPMGRIGRTFHIEISPERLGSHLDAVEFSIIDKDSKVIQSMKVGVRYYGQ